MRSQRSIVSFFGKPKKSTENPNIDIDISKNPIVKIDNSLDISHNITTQPINMWWKHCLHETLLSNGSAIAKKSNDISIENNTISFKIDKLDKQKWTALMYSCKFGQVEIAERLLKLGSDPKICSLMMVPASTHRSAGMIMSGRLLLQSSTMICISRVT